jgi:uncharacterized membrane protein
MVLEVNGPRRVPHPTKNERPLHDLASPAATVDGRHSVKVERSIVVMAPPEKLYAFWRDFTNHPRFVKFLEPVEILDDRRSRWTMAMRGGRRIEWESEIVNDQPNELIAWKTIGDSDVAHAGSVHFDRIGDGRTEVRLVMDYEPPGGLPGHLMKLFGVAPDQLIDEELEHFKALMEQRSAAAGAPRPQR